MTDAARILVEEESDETNVRVVVRVRPLTVREIGQNARCVLSVDPNFHTVTLRPRDSRVLYKRKTTTTGRYGSLGYSFSSPVQDKSKDRIFSFDSCLWSVDEGDSHYTGQEGLWDVIGCDFLDHILEGYNCCVFAYGQTGSGKTYSMMGSPGQPGLIPMICQKLFGRLNDSIQDGDEVSVHVSYFEVYNEAVYDLLAATPDQEVKKGLRVREDPITGPYVENLSNFQVKCFTDVQTFLEVGQKKRSTASTLVNEMSSRSHAVFTIVLRRRCKFADTVMEKSAQFRLVDLAGSERASSTGAIGKRLQEGANINKSLTTLGRVISALAEGHKSTQSGKSSPVKRYETIIPYRDSVLTFILKDSLGGNSKTAMLACLSPTDYEESLSTLRYAEAAKKIHTKAVVNEVQDLVNQDVIVLKQQLREMSVALKGREEKEGALVENVQEYQRRVDNLCHLVEIQKTEADRHIAALQTENDAMRRHLSLLLETISNPLPSPVYIKEVSLDDDSPFFVMSKETSAESSEGWIDYTEVMAKEISELENGLKQFRSSLSGCNYLPVMTKQG